MKSAAFGSLLFLATICSTIAQAQDRTFGDFDCTDDCSGHAAGYNWADKHSIDNESDCPDGNSQSFHEGCVAHARVPFRGADEDDDGNLTGEPLDNPHSNDDDDK